MSEEVKGLCIKCIFFRPEVETLNCYRNNCYREFAKRHKVLVVVKECKEFVVKEHKELKEKGGNNE